MPVASGAGDWTTSTSWCTFDHPELAAEEHAAVFERERVMMKADRGKAATHLRGTPDAA